MAIPTVALGAVGLAIATAVFLSNFLRVKVDPREPPVIHPMIPFFGHIIGEELYVPCECEANTDFVLTQACSGKARRIFKGSGNRSCALIHVPS